MHGPAFDQMFPQGPLEKPETSFYERDEQGGFAAVTVAREQNEQITEQYEALIQVIFQALYRVKRSHDGGWQQAGMMSHGGTCVVNINGEAIDDDVTVDENNIEAEFVAIVTAGMPTSPIDQDMMLSELRRRAPGVLWVVQVDVDQDMQIVGTFLAHTPIGELIDDSIPGVDV